MSINQDFIDRLRNDLTSARRRGQPHGVAYVSAERLKLIESEFAVEHRNGEMWIEGARLVIDPSVDLDDYRLN